ncbi:uncharacterized protein CXQ87_004621 [Candidozyma duobushaemuli]|uniref:Alpha/beta hydrolase fold-3 domain-containing protein n=1 Tax=Candidozyma duobushaemuli TaxID=1231522 RepID=A0A2V1AJH4_9ASCO|nr:uncharacterized protein CXQ87_004621 [[Candida] duobushaemulonis]PVH17061.1 hypothetical protein CXQ87_004621 [[Candida] duobushaemulonis]
MFSAPFLFRLITTPWVVLRIVVKFYTTGTALQADPEEFSTSLVKNIQVAVVSHVARGFNQKDLWFIKHPMNPFYRFYERQAGSGMPHFGEPVKDDSRLTWVVRPEGAKKALLFFHGGGYLVPMTKSQLVGIMAVWYALDREKRQNLAIANLDYSITHHNKLYPTQIWEAHKAYRELVNQGYEVSLIGDSAGANLCLALARFWSYPEAAKAQFSRFTQFEWNFSPLPAPRHLLLIGPWLEPYHDPKPYPGVDYEGDLGGDNGSKGLLYINGEKPETNYKEHWAKVPAFNGEGSTLLLYGEREIFRLAQEEFSEKNGKHNFSVFMQKGAIHDSMFYVEPLDLMSHRGQLEMVAGRHRRKFSFKHTADFLETYI